jgi:hypothetical protein
LLPWFYSEPTHYNKKQQPTGLKNKPSMVGAKKPMAGLSQAPLSMGQEACLVAFVVLLQCG